MRSRLVVLLPLLLLGATGETGIRWEKDFAAALKRARTEGKPIFVDFWADWCGWCHQLDRTTYVDPEVVKASADFVSVKVNAEGDRADLEIARRFAVSALPTLLFLSPNGRTLTRLDGYVRPAAFARALAGIKDRAAAVGAWEKSLAAKPDDPQALVKLGLFLMESEAYEEALELLTKARPLDAKLPANDRKQVRLMLGALLRAQRDYAQAEGMLKEGLALRPAAAEQDAQLLYLLGRVYMGWGKHPEARVTLKRLIETHPEDPTTERAKRLLLYLDQLS
jgi:thioredoxin-like negative regulator of GroEL